MNEQERAVVEASRKLYDADIAYRRAENSGNVAQLRKIERAKAKAVEEWRAAMWTLAETDRASQASGHPIDRRQGASVLCAREKPAPL